MSESKKRKKKSWKRILKHKVFRTRNFGSIISTILVVLLLVMLHSINLLPLKYYILITILLLLINGLGIIFINVHRKKALKIIGIILLVIIGIISIVGVYYLSTTKSFMTESFSKKISYEKTTYYVIETKKDEQKEIKGKIGTYKESIYLPQALEKIKNKYDLTDTTYDDIGSMFDRLNEGTEQYILLEKTSYEIVFSLSENLNKDDYRVVYEFDIYTKKTRNKNTNTSIFNIYVGGTDFSNFMDFNMIASVNTKNHTVLLTSIPRDLYLKVAGYEDGRYEKLSFMNINYGYELNRESLAQFLDTKIDYTILINTDSLVTVVDYVGGIDFCSDYEFMTTHALVKDTYNDVGKKLYVKKGCQHLNGIETLTVARERNSFPGRDRVRQENCRKILVEIIKKLISTDTIIHYNETLNTLSSLYETDIDEKIITNFAKDILANGNKWQIESQSIDGMDGKDRVHKGNAIDWVMYPDEATVRQAQENIKKALN